MERSSHQHAGQLAALKQLPKIIKQEKMMEQFHAAKAPLTQFSQICATTREAYCEGSPDVNVDNKWLIELVKGLEDAFLIIVPKKRRNPLRLQAERSVSPLAFATGSHVIGRIAFAELKIKSIMRLVLEAASKPYRGEVRLPAWDAAIDEARATFEATDAAWKPILERLQH